MTGEQVEATTTLTTTGLTLWLGSDDETGKTSLAGKDFYPNVLERLRQIRNLNDHPFRFLSEEWLFCGGSDAGCEWVWEAGYLPC